MGPKKDIAQKYYEIQIDTECTKMKYDVGPLKKIIKVKFAEHKTLTESYIHLYTQNVKNVKSRKRAKYD